ncbi:60S ribosomal protein L18a-like protein [Morus notabilis]|uniref:60S ribosomal protein L18a-like protein n=1 Tax=Morus notabilis TaxID=981085 RepID=UPI000CECED38|nr:60S ribosomal protein L18a-like protein [Morus notabilis]
MHESKAQHQPENKQNIGGATLMKQGEFALIESGGIYEKPLSCFGCGIGWFSFLLGFAFPPLWYYATVLYFGNHYHKDPRERPGLAASAIAALICTVIVLVSLLVVFC